MERPQNTPLPVDGSETEKIAPATPQKSVIPGGQKRQPTPRFYQFEQLNEVTIKMTDGGSCIVQGALGADNYKSTRALGYLMDVGGAWVACVGRRRSEPLPLGKAKAVARDMHRNEAIGLDHPDEIRALNLVAAQLVDRAHRAQERRERASRMKPTDWPVDLMGAQGVAGHQRGAVDPDLRRAILDTEVTASAPISEGDVPLRPSPLDGKFVISGDDYTIEMDADGYPELPKR